MVELNDGQITLRAEDDRVLISAQAHEGGPVVLTLEQAEALSAALRAVIADLGE
jgi:hypothetical protein